mgnify:CR=1 FL=1
MNKIIRDNYPVSKLPNDLRAELGDARSVRLTIEGESPQRTLDEILAEVNRLRTEGVIEPVTAEEAVARVRALRDEWDA